MEIMQIFVKAKVITIVCGIGTRILYVQGLGQQPMRSIVCAVGGVMQAIGNRCSVVRWGDVMAVHAVGMCGLSGSTVDASRN